MAAYKERKRVSKLRGKYNEYLRMQDPFENIPRSSKRLLLSHEKADNDKTMKTDSNIFETNKNTSNVQAAQMVFEEVCLDSATQNRSLVLEDHVHPIQSVTDAEVCAQNIIASPCNETDGNNLNGIDFHENNFEMQQHLYEMSHNNALPKENEDFEENDVINNAYFLDRVADETSKDSKEIYKGSAITLAASMLLIITFALKYSLTGEALNDLLRLIEMHCPPSNFIPQTLGKFKKWFRQVKHPLKFHRFCSRCNILLEDANILDGICPNNSCGNLLGFGNAVSHFIEIPIKEQIKSFFSRPGFFDDLQHRFTRVKHDASAYEDIYDGEVYKNLSSPGAFLSNHHNISLLWNTDGIPCFKSSKMSLWPLFFQINELPYHKRTSTENMIIGGLWFGASKPAVMSFTRPFIDCLQELERDGVEVTGDKMGTFKCCVAVIGGTADLPARSLACNTVQFNGKYGCCKCLQPGETFKIGQRGHCHVFPFQSENPFGLLRTTDGFNSDVEIAVSTGVNTHGVKGPSFMQCLMYYDLASGTCIDYMHGLLLGVTKLLMKLWFTSDHANEDFSISAYVDLVDKRLCSIKPPNNISRCQRSIRDHLNYWKAAEFKSWLLYYSLPILKDIHSSDIYQHYVLFVESVFLLLQNSVSITDVNKAESLLLHFCCMFAAYYGARYMTCNIHQLLHLPSMVRSMGPLWAYSCFPFENANGCLLKLYHGTQKVDMQIAQSLSIMQQLPELYYTCLKPDTPEMELYHSIKGTYLHKNEVYLQNNVYAIGVGKSCWLQEFQMLKLTEYLGVRPSKWSSFQRIRIGREVFHSRTYLRCVARNSYTVKFRSSGEIIVGQVEFYLQIQSHDGQIDPNIPLNVAIVSPLENEKLDSCQIAIDPLTSASAQHIHTLKPVEQYKVLVVPVESILHKCVYIELPDRNGHVYACCLVNTCEKE